LFVEEVVSEVGKYWRHVVLYVLTVASTYLVGGPWYALTLMLILTAHELGHYLATRYYKVSASLPFFIPFPFSPFGTLGAVIKMRGNIPDRKVLFDIGASGPLLGLLVTIPAIVAGLKLSRVVALDQLERPVMMLGEPILFAALERLVLGPIPEGYDVILHPVAFAGWVGLFVTALNLLPIGQLDGGHIVYSMLGPWSLPVFHLTLWGLVVVCVFYNPAWLLLVLLLAAFGLRHPPPYDMYTPLDWKRRWLGALTLVIFILSFTPVPFPDYVAGLRKELFSWLRF